MDWNWFFSSLAQSVAALVGVLGAFLISRLLNNEAAFDQDRERTGELLRGCEALRDRIQACDFAWYNRHTLSDGLDDVRYALRDNDEPEPAEDYYRRLGFSAYLPRNAVLSAISETVKEELEERGRQAREAAFQRNLVPSFVLPSNPAFSVAARQNLQRERDSIADAVIAIKSQIREVQAHLRRVQGHPQQSILIRAVLAAMLLMFWGGVMYPLSLLPVVVTPVSPAPIAALFALRSSLLVGVTVLFTALMLFLGFLNERLKHPAADLSALTSWLGPGEYSDFLAVRIDNGFPL